MIIHALIPARGGSKGIYKKNIHLFGEKPLIAHSIDIANKCKNINKVIVTTDDPEIANIAILFGADVPFLRPSNISEDLSRDYDFFHHYLKWTKKNNCEYPDAIVQFRPTSPIRNLKEVEHIISLFTENYEIWSHYDSLRTVIPVSKSPYKMYHGNQNDYKGHDLEPLFKKCKNIDEPYNAPRQLLPQCYLHDGYIDIVKTDTIMKKKSVSGNKIYGYVRNSIDYNDIDNITDIINLKKKMV